MPTSPPPLLFVNPAVVAENSDIGTVVGEIGIADPDGGDVHTFEIVSVDDAYTGEGIPFELDGVVLKTTAILDHESDSVVKVVIRGTDRGGLQIENEVSVLVQDVNEAPDLTFGPLNLEVDENVPDTIWVWTTSDPDGDGVSVAKKDGEQADFFEVNEGELRLVKPANFETETELAVVLVVTDAKGLSVEKRFVFAVNDVNEVPQGITISHESIAENAAIGTEIGELGASDVDAGDTHVFALLDDDSAFTIVGKSLHLSGALDYETVQPRRHVSVR